MMPDRGRESRAQAPFAAVLTPHDLPIAEDPECADDCVLDSGSDGVRCHVEGQALWV